MKQIRLKWWPLYVVLALLGGWLIYYGLPGKDPETSHPDSAVVVSDSLVGPGFYRMVRLLELDSLQVSSFRLAEASYQQSLVQLKTKLEEVDRLIIQELAQKKPDRKLLQEYARESGVLQSTLKQNTIEHFLNLHQLCNSEQQERLSQIFAGFQQGPRRQGRGQGRGWRRGRGSSLPES